MLVLKISSLAELWKLLRRETSVTRSGWPFSYLIGELINISGLSSIVGNSRFSFCFCLYLLKSLSRQAIEHYHNLFEKLFIRNFHKLVANHLSL